jgi:hypothetical protein
MDSQSASTLRLRASATAAVKKKIFFYADEIVLASARDIQASAATFYRKRKETKFAMNMTCKLIVIEL